MSLSVPNQTSSIQTGYDPEYSNENIPPDTIPAPSQMYWDAVDCLDHSEEKSVPQSIYENAAESSHKSTTSLGKRKAANASSSRTSRPTKRKNPTSVHEPFIIARAFISHYGINILI